MRDSDAELRYLIAECADRTAAAVDRIRDEKGSPVAVWAALESLCALRETWTRLTPRAVKEEEDRRLQVRARARGASEPRPRRSGRGRLAAVQD